MKKRVNIHVYCLLLAIFVASLEAFFLHFV